MGGATKRRAAARGRKKQQHIGLGFPKKKHRTWDCMFFRTLAIKN
jgi:hypothetical protein